ncbi:MAG: hypothetical protein RI949_1274 [Pseudomonadota bacterium]|jgi:transcriptional antiterminator RfaH
MQSESHPPPPSTRAWYLVHTKPRQEDIALINLERQGYPCYLPRLNVEKIRRGKAQIVREAMFPRYLFVQLDTGAQAKSWSPIRSTLGVNKLVYFGAQPAKVDPQLIALLQGREQALPPETIFQPGDAVVITSGPFAGIEAVYQTSDPERRSMILLEILSKPVTMHVEAGQLRKVG